jgi:hypothetical protein
MQINSHEISVFKKCPFGANGPASMIIVLQKLPGIYISHEVQMI